METATSQSRKELTATTLPPHLKAALTKHFDKCDAIGINPDWASQALDKANKEGNDFNPIHGLIS